MGSTQRQRIRSYRLTPANERLQPTGQNRPAAQCER